ncbi:hypothetical protein [Kitasatospora sp. NPDC097643]|uniref:hypothetical protein n=1 Tax=Kitasatospora sp. NPDC097643 TaxID=3157230 RepID=UPI003324BB73
MLLAIAFLILGFGLGALIATVALHRRTLDAARAVAESVLAASKTAETTKPPAVVAPTTKPARATPLPQPSPSPDDLPRLAPAGPQDLPTAIPRHEGDSPFHHSALWNANTTHEFPISFPDPSAVAMVEISAKTSSYVQITPITRTPTRVHTHSALLYASSSDGLKIARAVLPLDVTHLKIEAKGRTEWSVRLYAPSEVDELSGTREGTGQLVVALRPGAPSEVVLHVDSSSWAAEYICECWRWELDDECDCPTPEGLPRWSATMLYINGEGLETLLIPRPGLLRLRTDKPTDPWRLELRPYRAPAPKNA